MTSLANSVGEYSQIVATTKTNLGPVTKGNYFCQRFRAERNNLCSIYLWVATYSKQIDSVAKVSILDGESRQTIKQTEINTLDCTDHSWHRFSFDPIGDSEGKVYFFCFETNGNEEAITLWTNNQIQGICQRNGIDFGESICFKCDYALVPAYLLDELLFGQSKPIKLLSPELEQQLQDIILYCINMKEIYFLRLAHLVNAFGRTQGVRKVLSVGCGQACQEAFLAARFPELHVNATDLHPSILTFRLPNLHFQQLNILEESESADYDFVMSIECLEHIKDYRLAFGNTAAKVKPGKYLYISVPFASQEEQQDGELKKINWEEYEHYLPGFTFNDLETLFGTNGFKVIHSGNMFYWDLYPKLNRLLSKMDGKSIQASLPELVELFFLDIRAYQVRSRSEGALGVWFLGQKNLLI